jgi:hypothetical protein
MSPCASLQLIIIKVCEPVDSCRLKGTHCEHISTLLEYIKKVFLVFLKKSFTMRVFRFWTTHVYHLGLLLFKFSNCKI